MGIPEKHSSLTIDGETRELSHLEAFSVSMPGKGRDAGSDLPVSVVFSSHVYTGRTKHGEAHHLMDHNKTKRTFDCARYEMSLALPAWLQRQILADALVFSSRSFAGAENLVLPQHDSGKTWKVVFCLVPLDEAMPPGVRMEVLSAHPGDVDQRKISRRNFSYFARQCLFRRARVP